MEIRLKRAYASASEDDGCRVLVERLWPRGVSKERLALDAWAKELAPSAALRTWYGHEPERWSEFQRRYRSELSTRGEELDELLTSAAALTLVFAARDEERNSAVVLREVLLERMEAPS